MIKVDQIERIRKLVLVEGLSQRAAARKVGVSRHAVRVALAAKPDRRYTLTKPKPRPVTAQIEQMVIEILQSDVGAPRKQQHTARRVYHRLRDEYAFPGSEASVRRVVAMLRHKDPDVFLPLAFDPGQEAQVDFGEAYIRLNGKPVKVYLFCMKLAYSRLPFVIAFPHQRQEAFFEGHVQAFVFFGGVPHRLTYDNLKPAVRKILEGHTRQEQEAFIQLRAYYLFNSHFCTPGEAHEKGQVENLVGYVRRNALVPLPEVKNLAELNLHLRQWCEREKDRTVQGLQEPIGVRLQADRAAFRVLPEQPYDCARVTLAKVNRYAQVTYDTCTYSVPWQYAYRSVTVKTYVDRLEVWADQQRIASHQRSYERHGTVLLLDHYLEVFLRKPGALEYAIPFKQSLLPQAYHQFREQLRWQQPKRADREFVQLLMLHREYDPTEVHKAVAAAVERLNCSVDTVRALLAMQATPTAPPPLDPQARERFPALDLPAVSTAHFSRLLPKGGLVH